MVKIGKQFGEGGPPPTTNLTRHYFYDPVGNIVTEIDGRGVVTNLIVNERNQVVMTVRGAAHDSALSQVFEPLPLVDFQYVERFFYDHNGNLVLRQTEDRGNTSNVDGSPPPGLLPSNVVNPDPLGGPAFVDTVYRYNILDKLVEVAQEVENGGEDVFLNTLTRYDPNENRVLVIQPEGNASSWVYDERDLLLRSAGGVSSTPPLALMAGGDPTTFVMRGGVSSTVTYHYDGNRNVVEVVDAEDTDASARE